MQAKYLVICLAAALPMGFSAAALAQAAASPNYELSGTSISGAASSNSEVILTAPVGSAAAYKTESGVYLYPSVFVGYGHNDNLLSTATNTIGSNFMNVEPMLVAELKHNGDRYTAVASFNAVRYASSSDDNTNTSNLEVAGDNFFTGSARAGWSLGLINGSDPRGTNDRTISAEPDRWHTVAANGRFIYGAPAAQGRLEFDLGNQAKTYDNNRAVTAVADLNLTSVAGRVFYRLGSRTQALAEFRNAQANYASSLSTDSNTERRYYAGVTWEATSATTGIFKLGRMTKDFSLAGKEGFSGSSWEGTVKWTPLTYSSIDFTTSKSTADSSGFGNYNLNTSNDVSWNHKWTQSVTSRASFTQLDTDFGGTSRKDSTNTLALAVDYSVLRWLKIGIDLARADNTSSDPASAYKRNVTMFTLNASL